MFVSTYLVISGSSLTLLGSKEAHCTNCFVVTVLLVYLFAADTLTELFLSDLLRPDKKLREFEKCPLSLLEKYSSGNHVSRKLRLIHWYYEDQLKKLYYSFILALNMAAQDSVERNKEKAITAMYKLLAGNPEQEAVSVTTARLILYIIVMLDIVYHYFSCTQHIVRWLHFCH